MALVFDNGRSTLDGRAEERGGRETRKKGEKGERAGQRTCYKGREKDGKDEVE